MNFLQKIKTLKNKLFKKINKEVNKHMIKQVLILIIIIWMAIIFAFSSQQGEDSSNLSKKLETKIKNVMPSIEGIIKTTKKFNFSFIRKTAHIYLYAILGALTIIFFRLYRHKSSIVLAFLLSFIYATVDEIHQLYVPEREGKITDIGVDMLGAGAGILLVVMIWRLFNFKFGKSKI